MNSEHLRIAIINQCITVCRALVNQQRRLEKETYSIHKSQLEDPNSEALRLQRAALEQQVTFYFLAPKYQSSGSACLIILILTATHVLYYVGE